MTDMIHPADGRGAEGAMAPGRQRHSAGAPQTVRDLGLLAPRAHRKTAGGAGSGWITDLSSERQPTPASLPHRASSDIGSLSGALDDAVREGRVEGGGEGACAPCWRLQTNEKHQRVPTGRRLRRQTSAAGWEAAGPRGVLGGYAPCRLATTVGCGGSRGLAQACRGITFAGRTADRSRIG